MQTTENKDFSGHTELENNEQYLHKYNSPIVNLCASSIHEPDSILDFGAGIGTLSLILKNVFNIRPVTVEIDKKNARVLQDRGFHNFENIDKIENKFDLVFSSNVLEHIEHDLQALKEIRKKLSNKGNLFLYLPANKILWTKMDETVGHYRRYSKQEISSKLNQAGFQVVKIHFADSVGFFASLFMKLTGFDAESGLGSAKSLIFYDLYILPISKILDLIGCKYLFGKNIVVVAKSK